MALSNEQKQIAKALTRKQSTIEELSKALKLTESEIAGSIKDMLKLELVEKSSGYPTAYKLKAAITNELGRRKEIESKDMFKLRLKIIIEAHAIEEILLKKQLDDIETALRKEPDFTIYEMSRAKTEKSGEYYASFLEANLTVKNLKAVVRLMFFYAPTAIEVVKPKEFSFSMADLQDALVDWSGMVHGYTDYITKLMTREELEEFHSKLFRR